ncbi:MAG TPA: MaoC family dehydratase N-terminal domain-containing protein [Dehalococcoidia bacterium]|nr:MaoC family dehydratase N-terminal domain-containing protein [Dehalococcoidia bacterium]
MEQKPLITDEVRALIGTKSPSSKVTLTRRGAERAMEVFRRHRERSLQEGDEAPACAIVALESEVDGVAIPQLMPDTLMVGDEWDFERPLVVGESLTGETVLADISERFGGRFGYAITVRTEFRLSDSRGRVVAKSVRTMMHYDGRTAEGTR